ncbi:DUF2515 family protein [Scopulibacillus cellulosilyticus]|uniref:DUF2515 family protein n=1 Tax=Scopulibacillus cellulosilyticus TaxID=2665665 RepID=A0ABW2PZP1_9BACL
MSRTKAYIQFYLENPEIIWALLASMVSRNAGWNMTDLALPPLKNLLKERDRFILFHTYERPNWLIFSDAFPQLLTYHLSKQKNRPYFYLLKAFNISIFMEKEWELFWITQDKRRLCTSQIVNEQQVIEKPVIQQSFFHNRVFNRLFFKFQEWLHQTAVIFPTVEGALYGFSVYRFTHVEKRIEFGKQLSWLLFESPVSKEIQKFALTVEPTGSRIDYDQFRQETTTYYTYLRSFYNPVKHHLSEINDWFNGEINNKWFDNPKFLPYDISHWYVKKQKQIEKLAALMSLFCRILKKE